MLAAIKTCTDNCGSFKLLIKVDKHTANVSMANRANNAQKLGIKPNPALKYTYNNGGNAIKTIAKT